MRYRLARFIALVALIGAVSFPATASAGVQGQVLRVGLTQDFDASNPYQTALVSGFEAFQLSYNLLVDFGYDLKPVPGFAESWERAPDSVTFTIRDGMLWSDGEVADSADACFSWQLALDAIADDSNIGLGYLDTNLKDAGVTKVECPDATTMIAYTEDQSDRIFQIYLPIIPEHIWGEMDYEEIGEESFDAPLVGTGPYTLAEWRTGEFMRFVRNENYWGEQGFADEVVLQIFAGSDTMVQALRSGAIDYASGPNAEQLKDLEDEEGFETVVGSSNGWTQLAFNTYGTGTGKTIEGGGPSTQALLDPAFRDALGYAVDKPQLVETVLGGFGDVGSTIVPPVLGSSMRSRPRREPSIWPSPRRSSRRPGTSSMPAAPASTRRASRSSSGCTCQIPTRPMRAPRSSSRTGTASSESRSSRASSTATPSSTSSCRRRPATSTRPTTTSSCGAGPATRTRTRCSRSSAATRSGIRPDSQYCNPEYDALYDQQSALTGDAEDGDPRADAEPDLRPGRLRHPVLRRQPRRVPDRPVRRVAEHARQRHADLHLRDG